MTRSFKIAFTATSALLSAGMLIAVFHPVPARSLVRHYLSSRPDRLACRRSPGGASTRTVIFWAWERPEDLRFLDPAQAGVAFLARSMYITAGYPPAPGAPPIAGFFARPRLQPLRIAPGSQLIAVVRIETRPGPRLAPASLGGSSSSAAISYPPALLHSLASEISALQTMAGVSGVQIDFDATASQHAFYSALLQEVRRKLPASISLSITALASWCIGDPWLEQLPPGTIDDAIPMLFRMGPDSAEVVNFLRSGRDFPGASCRNSLGLSTDEPLSTSILSSRLAGLSPVYRRKKIYIFSPHPETPAAVRSILKEWLQ